MSESFWCIVILSHDSFRNEYVAVSKLINDMDPLNLVPSDFDDNNAEKIVKKSKHEAVH